MKAYKKPIEIEYYPCEVDYFDKILWWSTEKHKIKIVREKRQRKEALTIETLEGVMTATVDDMVIKGTMWEIYPCKKEIFDKIFEISK